MLGGTRPVTGEANTPQILREIIKGPQNRGENTEKPSHLGGQKAAENPTDIRPNNVNDTEMEKER